MTQRVDLSTVFLNEFVEAARKMLADYESLKQCKNETAKAHRTGIGDDTSNER